MTAQLDQNEVATAFEICLEEIEAVVDDLNQEGATAFQKGDYDSLKGLMEVATRLADFRTKVRTLEREWDSVFRPAIPSRANRPASKTPGGKLQRGLRTPEEAYRVPILETLIELGGSAPISKVLSRVEAKMKNTLNQYDRQALASNPNTSRWANSAQWCRNTLVSEGLLVSGSRYGIWEISPNGKATVDRTRVPK